MRQPEDELAELDSLQLRRRLRKVDSPQVPEAMIDDLPLLNFASNDYLGLANHQEIIQAMIEGTRQWGTGSGASRLICGSLPPHRQLEEKIAHAKGTEAALSFSNGYATSVGTVSALMQKGDTIILDKLSHASLIDGARLSQASIRVFPHNDLEKLEKLLKSTREKSPDEARILVVTESVFSMDGDHAPLRDIVALKEEYGALLLVDEAHGLGVLGKTGMGLAEELGCSGGIDLHMGTLGKAAGVAGGYIATSQAFVDLLINKARSFIYSTAAPPAQAAAACKAIEIIQSEEGAVRREQLWANIRYFSKLSCLETVPESAIIPWHVGESKAALTLSNKLSETGMLAPAVRYPTVPRNTARLRITLTAAHSKEDIDLLTSALRG